MEIITVAKHRRQTNMTARTVATATVAVAGASLLAPTAANAAEVRIPNSPITVQVPGIENVAGIASIPGIDAWIPSLAGQAGGGNVQAAIAGVRALPGVGNVPGFNDFLANVEAQFKPAVQQYSAQVNAPVVAPAPVPVVSPGAQLVEIARTKIGSPYVYGAAGPNVFDCSGFTSWVYSQAGKAIPRTSQAQVAAGTPVSLDQLQPGDIVAYYGGASHVGIYTGNGTIIDALNTNAPVAERPLHMMPIHSALRF